MKRLILILLFSVLVISGCISQTPIDSLAGLLRESLSSGARVGSVVTIPAGTVIDNSELARMIGISYTELGFFEGETPLIVNETGGRREILTASEMVTVYAEADCSNQITSVYAQEYDVYDCMVRFKPY